jgi:hypothetical protein
MYQTHRRWWTVADAAQVLRVHVETLYDACRADAFPHERWSGQIRIPCEALRMTYVPDAATQHLARTMASQPLGDVDQLELPLDPSCLIPARTYRNGDKHRPWDYEARLWGLDKPSGAQKKRLPA